MRLVSGLISLGMKGARSKDSRWKGKAAAVGSGETMSDMKGRSISCKRLAACQARETEHGSQSEKVDDDGEGNGVLRSARFI